MPQSVQWYMDITEKIFEGIAPRINPEIGKFIEQTDGLEGPDIGFLQIGYAFSPEPLTTECYIERGPYTKPSSYKTQMDEATQKGWLVKIDDGQYLVSEKGKKTVQRFLETGNMLFGDLPSLPEAESSRIADLLEKLVEKAYKLPKPTPKPTMEIGIRLNPGMDAPPILRIRRHLTDMNYFREDAHIAAWQPFYDIDGRSFETLTYLWREEVATPTEMAERLSEYRNYDESDYERAFQELVSHGWATKQNGKYTITEAGQKTRQEVENRTDIFFGKAFEALSEAETIELKGLLEKLAELVKVSEEEAPE